MPELVEGLASRGIVATRDNGADAILVTHPEMIPMRLPDGPILIGIHPAVSDDFDILVGPSNDTAGAVVDAIDRWLRATRVGIRIPAPHPGAAETWGDTHFARAFRNALRRAGWPARVRLRHVWDRPFVGVDDVVVDLLGLHESTSQPGAIRVLWQISHPELARPDLYDRYDARVRRLGRLRRRYGGNTRVPVQPAPPGDRSRALRAAGRRAASRVLVRGRLAAGRPACPRGPSADRHGPRGLRRPLDARAHRPGHLAGDAIPNAELPAYYGAASIVLNDHWAACAARASCRTACTTQPQPAHS